MITTFFRRISTAYKLKHLNNFENHLYSHDFQKRNFSKELPFSSNKVFPSTAVDDSEVFGTLEKPKNQYEFFKGDEGDRKEEERINKNTSEQFGLNKMYTKQIKELLKQRKLSEALSILDSGSLAKPDAYVYGLLIRACGAVGYTKKAFQLYNQMKKRGIKPRASIYTSLFNACSQSPWKEDGLSRASHLLNSLEDSGYQPNNINYNAIIKAFGRCGDLSRAFCLVDQMIDRSITPDSSTFAFLLHACASDQESGFRHAVLVWDKMLSNGVQPTIFTYNLMLRCCRDCDSGEGIDIQKLSRSSSGFQISGKENPLPISLLQKNDILTIPVNINEESPNYTVINGSQERTASKVCKVENIGQGAPQETIMESSREEIMERIIEEKRLGGCQLKNSPISILIKPVSSEDRLQCLGGCSGFLGQMAVHDVKPDIKTFTQLLEIIPSTESAEKMLMLALKQSALPEDVEFYNMLIKKRTMRFDYDGARSVLQLMSAAGLHPNIMTFGILGLGCRSQEEAAMFVAEVKDAGFRLNAEMIGGMVSGACKRWDVYHVLQLMELCIEDAVCPNAHLVHRLKDFRSKMEEVVQREANAQGNPNTKKRFSFKQFNIYKMRLTAWLKEIDLSEADEIHPWQQFRRHHKIDEKEISEMG